MSVCAFCEESIAAKTLHRGEHSFCSTECADSYFLTYPGEAGSDERSDIDDINDLDGYGDSTYEGLHKHSGDSDDDDDAL